MRAIARALLHNYERGKRQPVSKRRTTAQILDDSLAHDFRFAVWTVRLQPGRLRDGDDRWGSIDSGT